VPLAAALALALAAVTVVGALAFDVTGYGGTTELLVALGVLSAAALLPVGSMRRRAARHPSPA
jgi:hypothetical protein